MKYFLASFLCLLASCSRPPAPDLYKVLENVSCPNESDFRGAELGISESDALAGARLNMAREYFSEKLKDTIQIRSQNISQTGSSNTTASTNIEASLMNPSDAKLHYSKKQDDKVGVVVCMSRADAAKGFAEQQRLLADTLELVSHAFQATEHPKQKNESWLRIQTLWHQFIKIQNLLDNWGIGKSKLFDSANSTYSARRNEYSAYCQNAKLHWNPERETLYSEIVFSKLSSSIKMEKSPCAGNGISLAYKNSEPECMVKFGLNSCSFTQSLSLMSCDGTEYLQLKNDIIGAHQKPDFALEKLQGNLKSAEFWNQWIQEIQQWRPLCD